MKVIATMLAALALCACQSPFLVFPGGELTGTLSETDSFAFADRFKTLQLEVNPEDPYSVILRTTVIDGALYIDAASRRHWAAFVKDGSRVRIQLGSEVFNAVARLTSDESITARFLPGRRIFRIEPVRSQSAR